MNKAIGAPGAMGFNLVLGPSMLNERGYPGMSEHDLSAVGDHFIIGLRPGLTLDPLDQALLRDLRPAGAILFKSNFNHNAPYPEWLSSHEALIAQIRSAVGRERLLIAIDHEGGRVCRTPSPVTGFTYASRWADNAALVGRVMGRELSSLGFNLNFAPVLDIHSNPENPVIGERAFGSDADTVGERAIGFMNAMQEEGVLACGKHFPGHGDTKEDSHRTLPVSLLDATTLGERELRPFKAAIDAGIPMIMSSHILFPEIDPDLPATLSPHIVGSLLRKELGFSGVVVSDDVGMHAMDSYFDDPRNMVRFISAGSDMLMLCSHWTTTERARAFAASLADAIDRKEIDPDLVSASRARIHALLSQAVMHGVQPLPSGENGVDLPAHVLFSGETVEVV